MSGGARGRRRVWLLAGVAVLWVWFVTDSGVVVSRDEEAVTAATIFAHAVESIRSERTRLGIPTDTETDIHDTGLIGERYTPLTSTLGSLPAKRSGTTPDAAALLVRLIRDAIDVDTVREGGMVVAVNCSGSFPGFCVAALAACSALEIDAVATLSIGSSSWGANRPDFTLADIVAAASQGSAERAGERLPSDGVVLVTPGGADDRGTDLDTGTLHRALRRAEKNGYEVYVPEDLDDGITRREELYDAAGEVALLVTIGGNAVATGADAEVATWYGILTPDDPGRATVIADGKRDGLVLRYLRRDVPVVQILNVERLFSDWGLEYDPARPRAIGDGRLYRRRPGWIRRIVAVLPGPAIVVLLGMALRRYRR